jgi:hypothetical protein
MLDGLVPSCKYFLLHNRKVIYWHKVVVTERCLPPTGNTLDSKTTQMSIPDEDDGALPEPDAHAKVKLAAKPSM